MGQHKHNPTALLAKKGLIKPKQGISYSQNKRIIEKNVKSYIYNFFPNIPRYYK